MIRRIISYYKKRFWSPEKYAKDIGVQIGKGCLISTKRFPSEPYLIQIGNNCRIAKDVSFFTHGGLWSQRKKCPGLDYFGKIRIGDYTYIGEGAKILPGVSIGDDVIIGAGSVVIKSVENGNVVAGNPARVIGETSNFVKKIAEISLNSKKMSYQEKKIFLLSLTNDSFITK